MCAGPKHPTEHRRHQVYQKGANACLRCLLPWRRKFDWKPEPCVLPPPSGRRSCARGRERQPRGPERRPRFCGSGTGRVPGELLDVERVLATVEYWAISSVRQARSAWLDSLPPEVKAAVQDSPLLRPSTDWLEKLLPQVHAFLVLHRKHRLRFGEMATSISAPTQIFWSGMMLKPENRLTYPFKAFTQKAAANGLMSRHTYNLASCRSGGGGSPSL